MLLDAAKQVASVTFVAILELLAAQHAEQALKIVQAFHNEVVFLCDLLTEMLILYSSKSLLHLLKAEARVSDDY